MAWPDSDQAVYPGLTDAPRYPPATTVGWQTRQSRAGQAGRHTTVLDSMSGHAPAWGIAAQAITGEQQAAANPHSIEAENFELDFDQQGENTADFGSDADYTGLGGS